MTESTAETTETTEATAAANIATVEAFLHALQDQDLDTADGLLDDDLVYENAGFTRIRGRRATIKLFRRMNGRGAFEVKFHRSAGEGAAVLNERTDALIFGRLRVQFWVCGVFEVHDGKITLWRDYVDAYAMLTATLRGVVAMVFPSLRASF